MNEEEIRKIIIDGYLKFLFPIVGNNNLKNDALPQIYTELNSNLEFNKFIRDNKLNGKRILSFKNEYIYENLKNTYLEEFELFKNSLEEYYNLGYGFKHIAKLLGITYTNIRNVFTKLGIPHRIGCSVVTDKLRTTRGLNAIKSGGWRFHEKKSLKTNRGVQGYYYNIHFGKYVWLRSTWEYIYAKWLDSKNIKWDVEVTHFKCKNGEYYRPDFFIYNENNVLTSIVEIKGFWKNRAWKTEELNATLKIDVILIEKIANYLLSTTYGRELKKWKNERLLNVELTK